MSSRRLGAGPRVLIRTPVSELGQGFPPNPPTWDSIRWCAKRPELPDMIAAAPRCHSATLNAGLPKLQPVRHEIGKED
jgi:hypothetical protein